MRIKNAVLSACAVAAAFVALPASAAQLKYTFTSASQPDLNFTFNSDSMPAPINPGEGGFTGSITNFMGGSSTVASNEAFFYSANALGGIGVGNFAPYGDQLYSGSPDSPTLLTGKFNLFNDSDHIDLLGTLSVSDIATAAPEPATWAMMIVGFSIVGFGLRRKKNAAMQPRYA